MKYILNIVLALFLVSCAVSPDKQSTGDEYQKQADAEREKVATHGTLKGTPENINGIHESQEKAQEYQEKADDHSSTLFEKILAAFISLWVRG